MNCCVFLLADIYQSQICGLLQPLKDVSPIPLGDYT